MRITKVKTYTTFTSPIGSELQEVCDYGSVIDQVWDVAHGGLWAHLWVGVWVGVWVVSLSLSHLPVHRLRVRGDHLVHRAMTPTHSGAVHGLVRPGRSFEVPEALEGVAGGRVVERPAPGRREGARKETRQRGRQMLPPLLLLLVVVLPEARLWRLGALWWGLLVQSRGRGRGWNRVVVDLNPVGVHLLEVLTAVDLLLPEHARWGEEGRGQRARRSRNHPSASQDRMGGLRVSPSLDASGSSVLEPHLQNVLTKATVNIIYEPLFVGVWPFCSCGVIVDFPGNRWITRCVSRRMCLFPVRGLFWPFFRFCNVCNQAHEPSDLWINPSSTRVHVQRPQNLFFFTYIRTHSTRVTSSRANDQVYRCTLGNVVQPSAYTCHESQREMGPERVMKSHESSWKVSARCKKPARGSNRGKPVFPGPPKH